METADKTRKHLAHTHDRFFRSVMANRRVAEEFLKAHLPHDVQQAIDWKNLEFKSRSYIDDLRKENIVDILYKTKIHNEEAYLYLLLEHQSTPDELMPFRIQKYICNICDQHLKDSKTKQLPLIYPLVIYHASRPYPYSTDIKNLVAAPKDLIDKYFFKPFQLIDLGKITDQELKKHAWAGAMEFALKHIFARDILPYLKDIAEFLKSIDQAGGGDYISLVVQYIYDRGEVQDKEAFLHLVNTQISVEVGENIMTIAEQFKEQIKKQVKEEGRQEGKEQEKHETALRLIQEKLELPFVAKITGLSLDKLKKIQKNH